IVEQDVVRFLRSTILTLPVSSRQPIPSWSLAIEIWFYAAAPFLVIRSLRVTLLVLASSIAVRLSFVGSDADPWRYYLRPTVLYFFVLGQLAREVAGVGTRQVLPPLLGKITALTPLFFVSACDMVTYRDLDDPISRIRQQLRRKPRAGKLGRQRSDALKGARFNA